MKKIQKHKYIICLFLSLVTAIIASISMSSFPVSGINVIFGIAVAVNVFLLSLTLIDGPYGPLMARKNLERIGLVNRVGEAPFLLWCHPDPEVENGLIFLFENRNIPREKWDEKKADIEAAYNIFISRIKDGRNRRLVVVYATPASCGLPDTVVWSPNYLSSTDFSLILGQGLMGLVKVNLATVPHILLGGSTGSGKSVLLKSILMQCVEKGASVYIADFKGGIDFPGVWEESCHMILDEEKLLSTLKELTGELETRKFVLRQEGCANIHEYNTTVRPTYSRIIFACDEVAELLDKTGRSKADKEAIDTIISYLATIARQGRAMGIHLILATQRPDANIIPGQIRNNMDCRICGRADNILSQIILDNGDANDIIPKDAQGRFLMADGTVFQGFWFEDSMWRPQNEF